MGGFIRWQDLHKRISIPHAIATAHEHKYIKFTYTYIHIYITYIHEAKLEYILLTPVHNVNLTFVRASLLRLVSIPSPSAMHAGRNGAHVRFRAVREPLVEGVVLAHEEPAVFFERLQIAMDATCMYVCMYVCMMYVLRLYELSTNETL